MITIVFSRLLFIIKPLYPLSSSRINQSIVAEFKFGSGSGRRSDCHGRGGALAVLARNVLCSATRGQCRRAHSLVVLHNNGR